MAADRSIRLVLRAEMTDFKHQLDQARSKAESLGAGFDKSGNQINTHLGKVARSLEINREAWEKSGRTLMAFGAGSAAILGMSTKAAMSWESSWAGVTKTVDGTVEELDRLQTSLRDMTHELPASHQQIAAVAEAAGQLGVGVNDVASFTKTMIDLGVTTNLSAEEAATALARVSNIMGTAQGDVARMGATIVGLGNNFATSEREIVETTTRLAAAGKQAGLSEANVMAFATAMTSVGVEAEAGGTAMSKVFTAMHDAVLDGNQDLTTFASVAGMTADHFVQAYGQDAAGAIASFITGMGRMAAEGKSTTGVFQDLGLTDQRLMRAVLSLGSANDQLTGSLSMANREWAANTALTAEAEKRYGNAESKLAMAKNQIVDAAIELGAQFLPAVAAVAEAVGELATWFRNLPGPIKTAVGAMGGVATVVGLVGGGFLLMAPRIVETYRAFQTMSAVLPRLAGAASKAGAALKFAFVSSPIGLIITAAATALGVFAAKAADAKARVQEYSAAMEGLATSSDRASAAQDVLAEKMIKGDVDWGWWQKGATDYSSFKEAVEAYGYSIEDIIDITMRGDDAIAAFKATLEEETSGQVLNAAKNVSAINDIISVMGQEYKAIKGSLQQQEELAEYYANTAAAADGAADAHAQVGVSAEEEAAAEAELVRMQQEEADQRKTVGDAINAQIDNMQRLRDVQRAATDATVAAMLAEGDYYETVREAGKAIRDNHSTLDQQSKDGHENLQSLRDIRNATLDWVDALEASGAAYSDRRARMEQGRQDFIDNAVAAGAAADEAERLADEFGLIPDTVRTDVDIETGNAKQAMDDLRALFERYGHEVDESTWHISADGSMAVQTVDGLMSRFDSATGEITILANSGDAIKDADEATEMIGDREATINVNANYQAAQDDLDRWVRVNIRPRELPITAKLSPDQLTIRLSATTTAGLQAMSLQAAQGAGRHADGGAIGGVGGPRSDNQLIAASPGEHVLTASEVNALGGQGGVYRFRALVRAGQIQAFAAGGAVGAADPLRRQLATLEARLAAREAQQDREQEDRFWRQQWRTRPGFEPSESDRKAWSDQDHAQSAADHILQSQISADKDAINALKDRIRDLDDLAKTRNDWATQRRRGGIEIGSLSQGYSATDSLRSLADLPQVGARSQQFLKGVADQAEKNLAVQFARLEELKVKLADATKLFDDLARARDAMAANAVGQFSLATLVGRGSGAGGALTKRDIQDYASGTAARIKTYAAKVKKAAAMGFSGAFLQNVLSDARSLADAGQILDALISMNSSEVAGLNKSWSGIESYATQAGDALTGALYKGGISAAEGLVKGLESQQAAINKVIEQIAKGIAVQFDRVLDIHSPSRVMFAKGVATGQGAALGMLATTGQIQSAATELAQAALPDFTTGVPGWDRTGWAPAAVGPSVTFDAGLLARELARELGPQLSQSFTIQASLDGQPFDARIDAALGATARMAAATASMPGRTHR